MSTLPELKRSKISPKIFPTLPTLPRVWVISIYEKNYFSTLPTEPELKRSKFVPKYPQLCQLCLGSELFQFIRKIVSQRCQLCLYLKKSKISPKISPTLPRVWAISIEEKKYFSTLPILPTLKRSKLVQKYPQLCQLCLGFKSVSYTHLTLPTILRV